MNRRSFLNTLGLGTLVVTGGLFAGGLIRQLAAATEDATAFPHLVKVRLMGPEGKLTEPVEVPFVIKTDGEWKKQLTSDQYDIARGKGTEAAFCGVFYDNHKDGIYHCICCGLPLFTSDTKFDSGTGWPSFFQPICKENVIMRQDNSYGMSRTEILCARCDAHLGHVFNDGPAPTGQRFCLNSASLTFVDKGKEVAEKPVKVAQAAFAAGCFWGTQLDFEKLPGVVDTTVGFMGGTTKNPTYEDVCTDATGHAETLLIKYDPAKVTYEKLLEIFWENHDPTTLNRQGPDVGTQYRSVIFTYTPEQKAAAEASIAKLTAEKKYSRPIVTQVVPATDFWKAEEYHQHYDAKHGVTCRQ